MERTAIALIAIAVIGVFAFPIIAVAIGEVIAWLGITPDNQLNSPLLPAITLPVSFVLGVVGLIMLWVRR